MGHISWCCFIDPGVLEYIWILRSWSWDAPIQYSKYSRMVVSWLQYILYIVSKIFRNPKWRFDKFFVGFPESNLQVPCEILFEVYYCQVKFVGGLSDGDFTMPIPDLKRNYQFGDNSKWTNQKPTSKPLMNHWKKHTALDFVFGCFWLPNQKDPPGTNKKSRVFYTKVNLLALFFLRLGLAWLFDWSPYPHPGPHTRTPSEIRVKEDGPNFRGTPWENKPRSHGRPFITTSPWGAWATWRQKYNQRLLRSYGPGHLDYTPVN